MRLKIIRLIIYLSLLWIVFNLFHLQLIRGQFYYDLSINNSIRVVPLEGPRGRILDRNNTVLVDNRHAFDVAVIPQDIDDKDGLFDFLSRVLKTDKNKLLQRFWQRKIAPFAPVVVAEDVTKEAAMIIEESKFLYPGLYIQESFTRFYPLREVGAHVLGYVGKIGREEMENLKDYGYSLQSTIGKNGIENFYDAYLKGEPGGLQVEVNSRGYQVRLLGIREPHTGKDIQLTLDQRVQQAAYDGLAGRRGAVIIADLDSGEILGLVSSPSYDPNIFVDGQLKNQAGALFNNEHAPLLNRAIKGQYPPGSVFKIAVTTAGLASGEISSHTTFFCDGAYQLGQRSFRCGHVHRHQDLLQAIMHSCNIYFFNAGDRVGADLISKYARLLGLGDKTEIDLPFEEKGLIPSPLQRKMKSNQGWYKGDTLNFSIGQGDVLATPIQLLRMMATVARDGREPQLHLLKSINAENMVKLSTVRHVNLDDQIFKTIQTGLRMVVSDEEGTARLLDMPELQVAGKTGTAQSAPGKDSHAWFVGYTTKGRARLAICVFLEYGGSSYNAVVLTQQILKQMIMDEVL